MRTIQATGINRLIVGYGHGALWRNSTPRSFLLNDNGIARIGRAMRKDYLRKKGRAG